MKLQVALTLLGIVAFGFTIMMWFYWALALPILRRQLSFRTENALDRFKILGLTGEVPPGSRLYGQIAGFLEEARDATAREGYIIFERVSDEQIRDRSIRLKALLVEMDSANPNIRHMVGDTMNSLVSLYVAQRPFVVCVVVPLKAAAYFVLRLRDFVQAKEVEFAASSLAAA